MSFLSIETSRSSGQPFELYEFTYGPFIYRYNTTASEVVISGFTYVPMQLSRQNITLTSDVRRSQLQINAPADFEVASFFRASIPATPISVTIKKKHRNDAEVITEWIGRIMTAEWKHSGVTLICESYYTAIQGNANFRYYNYSCPHMLYGSRCKVNRVNYKVVAIVQTIQGNIITSSTFGSYASKYFTGGYLMFHDYATGFMHTRHIVAHSGNTITMSGQIPELAITKEVEVYPGCDHTLNTCKTKFSNLLNFGGFPWIPTKNPFTGSVIFW
jgi:uncharacterized phage protein (TIGR02218 family)